MRRMTLSRLLCAHVAFAALLAAACSSDEATNSPTNNTRLAPLSARTPANVNVVSTMYDTDATGNLLLTRSDDRSGVGYASYSGAGITSQIAAGSAWQLLLGNQTARTLYLVLGTQGMPNLQDGYYYTNVEAFSRCFAADGSTPVSLLDLTAGASTANCSFGVDFTSGKTKYKLAMGSQFAGTGRAVVTCTAAATSCTAWSIAPNANVTNAGVANLYHYAKNGSLVLDGAYHDSYFVTATR